MRVHFKPCAARFLNPSKKRIDFNHILDLAPVRQDIAVGDLHDDRLIESPVGGDEEGDFLLGEIARKV